MRLLHIILLLALLPLAGCSPDAGPLAANAATVERAGPSAAAIARGRVAVDGGLIEVAVPQPGQVERIAVRVGDGVKRGDALLMLDKRAAELALGAAEARVAQARAQKQLLAVQLKATRISAARQREAAAAGAGAAQAADDAEAEVAALAAQEAAASAAIALEVQEREQAILRLDERTIRAPVDGRVVQIMTGVGRMVDATSGTAMVLLPVAARIVRAEIGTPYLDRVKPGMPVRISTDDDSGVSRHWQGRVQRIGEIVGHSMLEEDPEQRQRLPVVECVVEFDEAPNDAVRVGQRVIVKFGGTER